MYNWRQWNSVSFNRWWSGPVETKEYEVLSACKDEKQITLLLENDQILEISLPVVKETFPDIPDTFIEEHIQKMCNPSVTATCCMKNDMVFSIKFREWNKNDISVMSPNWESPCQVSAAYFSSCYMLYLHSDFDSLPKNDYCSCELHCSVLQLLYLEWVAYSVLACRMFSKQLKTLRNNVYRKKINHVYIGYIATPFASRST